MTRRREKGTGASRAGTARVVPARTATAAARGRRGARIARRRRARAGRPAEFQWRDARAASAHRRRGDRRARRGRSAKREAAGASGAKGAREPVEEEGWRNGRVVVVRESRESGPGGVLRDHPQTLSRDDPTAGLQRPSLENSSVAPSIFDRETQFTRPTGSTNPHAVPRHRDVTGFDSRNRAMGIQSAPNSRELLTWSPREKAAKLLVSSPGRRRALLLRGAFSDHPAGNGGLADALRGRKGRFTSRSSRVEARHRRSRRRAKGGEGGTIISPAKVRAVCPRERLFLGTRLSTPRSRAGFGARARGGSPRTSARVFPTRSSTEPAPTAFPSARSRSPRPHPGACPGVSFLVVRSTSNGILSRKPQNARPRPGTADEPTPTTPPDPAIFAQAMSQTRRGSKEPARRRYQPVSGGPAGIHPARAACVPRRKRRICTLGDLKTRGVVSPIPRCHRRRSASDADAPVDLPPGHKRSHEGSSRDGQMPPRPRSARSRPGSTTRPSSPRSRRRTRTTTTHRSTPWRSARSSRRLCGAPAPAGPRARPRTGTPREPARDEGRGRRRAVGRRRRRGGDISRSPAGRRRPSRCCGTRSTAHARLPGSARSTPARATRAPARAGGTSPGGFAPTSATCPRLTSSPRRRRRSGSTAPSTSARCRQEDPGKPRPRCAYATWSTFIRAAVDVSGGRGGGARVLAPARGAPDGGGHQGARHGGGFARTRRAQAPGPSLGRIHRGPQHGARRARTGRQRHGGGRRPDPQHRRAPVREEGRQHHGEDARDEGFGGDAHRGRRRTAAREARADVGASHLGGLKTSNSQLFFGSQEPGTDPAHVRHRGRRRPSCGRTPRRWPIPARCRDAAQLELLAGSAGASSNSWAPPRSTAA